MMERRRRLHAPHEIGRWRCPCIFSAFLVLCVHLCVSIGQPPNEPSIALLKTHKTGSTTLNLLLRAYAEKHNKTITQCTEFGPPGVTSLPQCAEKIALGQERRADFFIQHSSRVGQYMDGDFGSMRNFFKQILVNPDNVRFITILREPTSHFLSYYFYFVNTWNHVPIEEYLLSGKAVKGNIVCGDFGIYDEAALDKFISTYMREFTLILTMERFEEGVVLMARLLGWDLTDATYAVANVNDGNYVKPVNGEHVARAPHFEDLSSAAQARVVELTEMDRRLYAAASNYYEEVKARYGDGLQRDLETFLDLQAARHCGA